MIEEPVYYMFLNTVSENEWKQFVGLGFSWFARPCHVACSTHDRAWFLPRSTTIYRIVLRGSGQRF